MQVETLASPQTLSATVKRWEEDFTETSCLFADKVAENIAIEMLSALKLSAPVPSVKKVYHLDLRYPQYAKQLKQLGGTMSELSPYKEWFEMSAALQTHSLAYSALDPFLTALKMRINNTFCDILSQMPSLKCQVGCDVPDISCLNQVYKIERK